jgi:ketosteroid isomerase-like protein
VKKKPDLGLTMQIIANFCVVAGIVLLALEVDQNSELIGVEARANGISRVVGTADIVLQNPELIALLGKHEQSLTQAERDTVVLLGIRSLSTFQSAWLEVAAGFRDEAELRRTLQSLWRRPRLNYGMPLAWPTFRERAKPAFVEWMEANVVGEQSAAEQLVRSLDDQERAAALARDIRVLERLWSDDFTVNAPNNEVVVGKQAVLGTFVHAGVIDFSSFERQVEFMRIDGRFAVLMGLETVMPKADAPAAGLVAGRAVKRRFTNVWRNEDGTWRLYWRHANVLPAA